ncbi:MAG: acylphosphatase [Saprospiraceae bacterium]|nr:acylphosphatase [Saprospiraceae bacterium]
MKSGYSILVTGKVQGVGFRRWVLDQAKKHGISGWTANLPDGKVEIHAEGSSENLIQFVKGVRTGPIGSKVENICIKLVKIIDYQSFTIKRL